MAKWKLELAPELIPVPIDPKHYKQLLAEIANLLVESFLASSVKSKSTSRPIGNQTGAASAAER